MDLKRLKEWIGTIEGLAKTVATLLGMITGAWAVANDVLGKFFARHGMPSEWWPRISVIIIFGALALILWRSYQRFTQASRLEQPDAFTLRPTDPSTLIGRADDLTRLLRGVKQYRLVLLDGESGCGKSALVTAGLVPVLLQTANLLPVPIREWGDDWVRGPFVEAVEALFYATSATERERLGWAGPPDLTADTQTLADDFDARLHSVVRTLNRRTLLIADQFDDYQARHRSRFLDSDANWLSPTALGAANRFWNVIRTGLAAGHLHLLVVTRADSAAGLSCVRFLGEDLTATHTLARVETEYLRPLLVGIAPDGASPPVVSHPEGGWQELRVRLERDLKAEGAILMQQVRTVILGLRQLPLLTPKQYVAAGGLRGLETVVISRAILHAGNAAGGGDAGRRVAGAILRELVVPGGPNQPPKARRLAVSHLVGITGDRPHTEAALVALQHEEVVRPAETLGGESAWQLDHDYLARAVLAEAGRVNRWTLILNEGKARYDDAAGSWRRRYAALLPVGTLVRLCWERGWGRLSFGAAAHYAQISALKPAVLLLCLAVVGTGAYGFNQRRLLTADAEQLVSRLGRGGSGEATLAAWRAPERLRMRVYDLLRSNTADLERAVQAYWHLAYAGLEPPRAREAAALLREGLTRERNSYEALSLETGYGTLSSRLDDATAIKAEVASLRATLEQERASDIVQRLVRVYAAAAARLTDPDEVQAAVVFLRSRLEQERGEPYVYTLLDAYETVAARLNEAAHVQAEAEALRSRFEQESDSRIAGIFLPAYEAVIKRMSTPADVKDEATALRTRLRQELRVPKIVSIVQAYQAVAARLNNAAGLSEEAADLRARLEQEPNDDIADALGPAYAAVAAKLSAAADLKAATSLIRTRLEQLLDRKNFVSPRQSWTLGEREADQFARAGFGRLARAYEVLAGRLTEPADVRDESLALRTRMQHEQDTGIVDTLLRAYSVVVARMSESADVKAEVVALRRSLPPAPAGNVDYVDPDVADVRATVLKAYQTVAERLTNPADIKAEIDALRAGLEPGANSDLLRTGLLGTYAALAAKLNDEAAAKAAVAFLRTRVEQESKGYGAEMPGLYAQVATRLKNAVDLNEAVAFLRTRIEQDKDAEIAVPLVRAYATVAARLTDAAQVRSAAEFLRVRVEHEELSAVADTYAYAQVAVRLNDADVKSAAAFLRPRLVNEGPGAGPYSLARAYVALASRLREAADVKAEILALRTQLERSRDKAADGVGSAYAAMVTRLNSMADLEAERRPLRAMLEQAQNQNHARNVGHAYAAVLRGMVKLADKPTRPALILEILTLAGHPFLSEPKDLLGALTPASKVDFSNDLGDAVRWATKTYGFQPMRFRPPPLDVKTR